MRISVILSTYNAPALLEPVLCGYRAQTDRNFEVVVADDGSGPATRALVERFDQESDLAIRHVWHEDRGFRKCRILNAAIREARGEYLIFSDGDCIPRRDLVATHTALRSPGRFLSGGYIKLPREVSGKLTAADALDGRATRLEHLAALGLEPSLRHRMRLAAPALLARILDLATTTKPTWNGHNASGWRDDLVAANGFDERMGWGGEDRELGERLENAGVRGMQVRHRAVCVHLWHERGYVNDAVLERNRKIRRDTARRRSRYTPFGIDGGGEAAAGAAEPPPS